MIKLLKKIWKFYQDGFIEIYKPLLDAGVNPFLQRFTPFFYMNMLTIAISKLNKQVEEDYYGKKYDGRGKEGIWEEDEGSKNGKEGNSN